MQALQGDNKERLREVDILRGFAVLGICLVNIPEMLGSGIAFVSDHTGTDAFVRLLYDMLVQTKFYTLFAFLFGLSFYLFMRSAERRGLAAKTLMTRRLLLLFLIGMIHGVVLWFGDVLHTYAILGFILMLFYKRKEKTMLIWSWSLLILSGLIIIASTLLAIVFVPEELSKPIFQTIPNLGERIDFLLTYSTMNLLLRGPEIMGLFLLGLYAGKKGWFEGKGLSKNILRRWQWISLLLTLLFFIPMVNHYMYSASYNPNYVYHYTYLSGKTMAVFYFCTLLRLIQSLGEQRLNGLAAVGRMAFTNYLTQSIITMLILYVVLRDASLWPLWACFIYSVLLLILQVGWSQVWLRRHGMGPLEWVWRAGTYWKRPTLREKQADSKS
ncbi:MULTISPECIES: DUF418 domain-containing protein [unclassified Paenibacillus]|uniref:DUF418 domain-containing protein n=1 Tax=unclassified Paenibacillus TaxID=185978 RepID=UPI001AE9E41C|nr:MULTISPECIES: DUF418 domain-containing protein [unclassified Paenibacillus]MBP1155549.1 uncharacterized protein [Paenibacillus sp. PvP091]MBP1169065.1 uncharacterized protein [Paenibacillus sp. PvR098]MBP2440093.1 uncharacterized protein [Paenibacillus sp. PvP052]